MNISVILEISIGLVLIYYILGLIVNVIIQQIKGWTDLRAKALEMGLSDLLESQEGPKGRTDHMIVIKLPFNWLINLIRGKPEATSNSIIAVPNLMQHPLIKNLEPTAKRIWGFLERQVEEVPNTTFSAALLDLLKNNNKAIRDTLREAIENLQMDDAVKSLLLDQFKEIDDDKELLETIRKFIDENNSLKEKAKQKLLKIIDFSLSSTSEQMKSVTENVQSIPNKTTREALLSIINLSGGDISGVQKNIENWFDNKMKDVADIYKRNVRSVVMVVSFILVFAINADTIAITQFLQKYPLERQALNAYAAEIAVDASKSDEQKEEDVKNSIDKFLESGIPLFWNENTKLQIPEGVDKATYTTNFWFMKISGLLITSIAVSQGSSFWYDILRKATGQGSTSSTSGSSQVAGNT
ncbi:MAG: hypothetical protein KJ638_11325 [Chloroflexi bacterium]|nr:hypothetical protein [Chloroflexota bacterium]